MGQEDQPEARRTRYFRRSDGDALCKEKADRRPSGKDLQRPVTGAEAATCQRPPDDSESRQTDRADHRYRGPGRQSRGEFKGQQNSHRGNQSRDKKLTSTDDESRNAGRDVEHEENAEQRPRRYCEFRPGRNKEQEGVTNQQQIYPAADNTRLRRIFGYRPVADQKCTKDRKHRETCDHDQRRHQSGRHIRRHPPGSQDKPRQNGPGDRQNRDSPRRPLQEKPSIEHHQHQGEAPQCRLRRCPESNEKQQCQADQQQHCGTTDRHELTAETASEHRHTEVEKCKNSVHREACQESFFVQITHRPDRLGNNRKERRHEVQRALAPGDRKSGNDCHQREEGGKDRQRCSTFRLDRDQRRKNEEQARRGQNRVFRDALERSPDPLRNYRYEKE